MGIELCLNLFCDFGGLILSLEPVKIGLPESNESVREEGSIPELLSENTFSSYSLTLKHWIFS